MTERMKFAKTPCEVSIVLVLFERFGIPAGYKKALWEAGERRYDRPYMFLDHFAMLFPEFPVDLVLTNFSPPEMTDLPYLMQRKFYGTRLCWEYEELCRTTATLFTHAKISALIFPWTTLNGRGGGCLHSYDSGRTVAGTRLEVCFGGRRLWIESLRGLIERIIWEPPEYCEDRVGQLELSDEFYKSPSKAQRYFWDEKGNAK